MSSNQPAALPVHEVIRRVRAWVAQEAALLPNFAGAYLWAGITAMAKDELFHLYRDVDVVVVLREGAPDDEGEVLYDGLSIEIIWKNLDEHLDVEAALANPSAGPNLAATQILADPTGALTTLQRAVAERFAEPRWIAARCDGERRRIEEAQADMRKARTPAERLDSIRALLMGMSGLLAVAKLRRPTTRRTLALLSELLEEAGRNDLKEQALAVMGSAAMSPEDVEDLLATVMHAYDRSVEVYRTPIAYGFTLREHLRPYYAQGAQEMIDEGRHREAVFWIACLDVPFFALANDAPEGEKAMWAEKFRAFYAALGIADAAGWTERVALAEGLLAELEDSIVSTTAPRREPDSM